MEMILKLGNTCIDFFYILPFVLISTIPLIIYLKIKKEKIVALGFLGFLINKLI